MHLGEPDRDGGECGRGGAVRARRIRDHPAILGLRVGRVLTPVCTPTNSFLRAPRRLFGCLTVLGTRRTRERIPWGKPWDRQPISGKLRRKFGVSPGFAAYFAPQPPKRLST